MNRQPITRIRSRWRILHPATRERPVLEAERHTSDGDLRVLVTDDPGGLHLSISHTSSARGRYRYPTWDEIADARDVFLPADIGFVMHLPPAGEYVAVHPTTFHLHQHPARTDGTA